MTPRSRLVLDQGWSFTPDPGLVGLRDRWFDRTSFDRRVPVPSPWQLYDEAMRAYTGTGWYHAAFEVPEAWGDREVAIAFDAVDYEATVWIDGARVAFHEGGYTPFEAIVPAGAGTRHVVVRVVDPPDNSEIPHGKQGSWYTRVSGLWQPVGLVARPKVHIKALRILPDPENRQLTATIEAAAPDGTAVTVRCYDPDGAEVASFEGTVVNGGLTHRVSVAEVRWWSPETPQLYKAIAELGEDRFEVTFGMRSVHAENGRIFLNGEPLVIRGALDQGFWPETIYLPPSLEAIENEIQLAKAMGLNLLRKHIKLEDPRYLDACDRLGMLVWEEPACYAKHTPQAKARFTREIEGMIARDFNHPSIIAWSLYNEEWGLEWRLWRDEDKQAHVEALYDHAKALDPSRLICDNSGWAHVKTDLNDYHRYFTAPDLIDEWKADLAHCLDRPEGNFVAGKQNNAQGVPVLVSEFGVWGLPEPSRITGWYGGRPWWFDAVWAGHTEAFKYPATAERNFDRFKLEAVFGSLDGLAEATQRRMMRALKPIIEAMRQREDLAGWVVTELTDIEWESNGWLDYFRKPKAGFEEFAWFHGPVAVMATLPRHNLWEGEAIAVTLSISNHTREAITGSVRWRVRGVDGLAGEVPVDVRSFATASFQTTITAPAATAAATLEFELVRQDGTVVARNEEAMTFTERRAAEAELDGPLALRGEAARLATALGRAGHRVVEDLSPDTLILTTTLDAETRSHLEAGGRVLFVAEAGEAADEKGLLSFRRLPRGESWDRASSIFYGRAELAGDLGVSGMFGWELEGIYPHHVVPLDGYLQDFGGRLIELPGNQANVDPAGIWAGYFEGWLGKFAASVLAMPYEAGTLVVTTLRLLEQYGDQPVGTRLLHRLLARAGGR